MMEPPTDAGELTIKTSLARHLALSPVAFAVTEGPSHDLVYTNALFRELQSAGEISVGAREAREPPSATDLTPVLDRVYNSGTTERDARLPPTENDAVTLSCTVWPVRAHGDLPQRLVIEVRDVHLLEAARVRQRAVAERLLLSALREQDAAHESARANTQAQYLAKVSRDLSMSLDEPTTRDTVRMLTLPRPGTWCIVDVIESN